MFFKTTRNLRASAIATAGLAAGVFQGMDFALADPVGTVTNTAPVQQTLESLQNTATAVQNTATDTITGTGTLPVGGLTLSDFGGTSLSGGWGTTGTFRTDTFFLEDSSFQTIFRDPNSPSYLPVKAGVALLTARTGKFRLEFNYGGRFNGDFEEHQALLKLKGKF